MRDVEVIQRRYGVRRGLGGRKLGMWVCSEEKVGVGACDHEVTEYDPVLAVWPQLTWALLQTQGATVVTHESCICHEVYFLQSSWICDLIYYVDHTRYVSKRSVQMHRTEHTMFPNMCGVPYATCIYLP